MASRRKRQLLRCSRYVLVEVQSSFDAQHATDTAATAAYCHEQIGVVACLGTSASDLHVPGQCSITGWAMEVRRRGLAPERDICPGAARTICCGAP
eukprot:5696441-Amphidinium_carterae.1